MYTHNTFILVVNFSSSKTQISLLDNKDIQRNGRVFNEKIRRRRQKSCSQFKLSVSHTFFFKSSTKEFFLGFELWLQLHQPQLYFAASSCETVDVSRNFFLICSVAPLPFSNSLTLKVVSLKIKIIYRLTINGLDFHLSVACSNSFEMLLIKFNSLLIFF